MVAPRRGEIWWASLGRPTGSEPGYRRPVVVLQADDFNESALQTVLAAALTSNLRLALAPGNIRLTPRATGLERVSVVNASQIATIDKNRLTERVGRLKRRDLEAVEEGVRLILAL